MNRRLLISGACFLVCLAALTAVVLQGRQLRQLRAEDRQLLARDESKPPGATELAAAERALINVVPPPSAPSPSLELLRLRSEVNRLTGRHRELSAVRKENDQLRKQVAASNTNFSTGTALPPGYVRKSEARFMGYNTPADTLQSLLWALQNRDFTNVMAAFAPEMAAQMQSKFQKSGDRTEEFFQDAAILPGLRIVSQAETPDGTLKLMVEMVPGVRPEPMSLRQFDGQWKLISH